MEPPETPSSQPGKAPGPRASRRVPPTWLCAHWQCQGFTRRRAPAWPLSETRQVLCERSRFLARCRALSPWPEARSPASRAQTRTPPSPQRSARGRARSEEPPLARIRRPAPGRTPPEASRRRKGKSGARLRPPPFLLLGLRPLLCSGAGPPPALLPPLFRTGRPVSLQSLDPGQQLPRGWGPRASRGAPHSLGGARATTRRASAPASALGPGKGARAPAGSPEAADFIRAVVADGPAGRRRAGVFTRGREGARAPPAAAAATTVGGDGTRAARGRGAAGGRRILLRGEGRGRARRGEHEGGAEDTSCGCRGLSTLVCAMGLWVPARRFKLQDYCFKLRKCRRAGGEEEGSRRGGREGEGGARLERRRQFAAGPTGSGSKFSLWSLRVSVRAGPGAFQRTRS